MTIKHCNFNGFFILTDENPVYLRCHNLHWKLKFYISGQEQDFFLKLSPKFMLLDKHLKKSIQDFSLKILFPSDIANEADFEENSPNSSIHRVSAN